MSTAVLDIWITSLGEPCSIASDAALPHAWVVAVSHCDGRVLNWSEGRFRWRRDDPWIPIALHRPPGGPPGYWFDSIPSRDGHVELEVPPSCYVVRATMHSWFVNGNLYGNWATDRAIVHATCGGDVCATLYAPSAPACSVPLFEFVIPLLVRQGVLKQAQVGEAVTALARALPHEAASQFEQREFETLARAFDAMGKRLQGVEPRRGRARQGKGQST